MLSIVRIDEPKEDPVTRPGALQAATISRHRMDAGIPTELVGDIIMAVFRSGKADVQQFASRRPIDADALTIVRMIVFPNPD